MPSTAKKHPHKEATYEDLLKVPDHLVAEIIDGELWTSPRPAARHATSSSFLGGDLLHSFGRGGGGSEGPGGWWILDEPELHFGNNVVVPDLAGWRRKRMPMIPDVPYFTLAPDWVCEILSPSTMQLDRVKKMNIYADEKVSYLWLLDPSNHTLEVYHLKNNGWHVSSTHVGNGKIRAKPFDAVKLEMKRWWIDP